MTDQQPQNVPAGAQMVQFRLDETEVAIHLEWPSKGDLRRFKTDLQGIDPEAAVTYLDAVKRDIKDSLDRGGRPPQEGGGAMPQLVGDSSRIIPKKRWGIHDQRDQGMPRLMITDKINHDTALWCKEWKYWTPNEQATAVERPPAVQRQHAIHSMQNLKKAKNNCGIAPFIGGFQNKAVVIVGSGPSLAENGHEIPADDERFVTIAINEACQQLDDEQIDFVFAADRAIDQHAHKWYSDELRKTTPLICTTNVPEEVVDTFEDVYFFRSVNMENADDEQVKPFIQHLHPLDVSQFATYSAFHLAYMSGSPYILFAGQDFACTNEKYSANRKMTPEIAQQQNHHLTSGINENVVLTCDRLKRNMRLLKGQSAFVGDDNRVVVNGSDHGVLDLECPPNTDSEKFTPENNRNLPLKDAVHEARQFLNRRNGHSKEIKQCQTMATH